MYLDFFGLDSPPFKITPHLELFYSGGKRGAVLDALLYAVSSNEGIVKVVGEVGSGKTMLCRTLEARLPDTVETLYLANPSLSRDEVLYAIADELGLDLHGQRPAQMLRTLQEHLIDKYADGRQVVVFIDEAQAMPLDALEEIRLLSNLETGTHKLLQILLFGQPELDQHLALPQIRQLRERITHSFNLSPLASTEIRDYLMFRMRAVGYKGPDVFSPAALRLIARASEGLIRRINILADKALLAAFAENSHEITGTHAKAAIRDSGLKTGLPWKKIALTATAAAALLAAGAAAVSFFPTMGKNLAASPPAAPAIPAVSPAPSALSLLDQRLQATEKWLAEEAPGHYTLQLSATNDDDRDHLERMIRDLGKAVGSNDVYLYPTQVQKRPGHSFTYGNFANYDEAKKAAARLPAPLQAKHPVLRTVGGIRAELTAQQAVSNSTQKH